MPLSKRNTETEPKSRYGTTNEVLRGAAVSMKLAGHSLKEISSTTDIPKSTIGDIVKSAFDNSIKNTENQDPLNEKNLLPKKSSGRPPKFSAEQHQMVIDPATKDASNRRKSFKQLSRECQFHISDVWLAHILQNAGYTQHIPWAKPRLTGKNREKRHIFCTKYKDQPIIGFWDSWIWTDEMYFIVGSHYGPERVIRNKDEEYHPDCVDLERPGETRIMFWGAIKYNIPCRECPFYIWEEETPEEKETAVIVLSEENQQAEEAVKELKETWYQKEMERRKSLPKRERPRGRPKNPYKVVKKTRGKKRKSGIDWFRYRENVCKPLLYPFYDKMIENHRSPSRLSDGFQGAITLVEDGAGPHRAKALNEYHHERGINKIDWPASSPDFNAIERVWDLIRKKISERKPFPHTKAETERAWIDEWNRIPVEKTNSFIEGVPRRLNNCYLQQGNNLFHG